MSKEEIEDSIERIVYNFFKDFEFNIEKLKTRENENKKTADYKVNDNKFNYFVEVKSKEDSKEYLSKKSKLKPFQVLTHEETIGYQEKMKQVIVNAKKQLDSTTENNKDFKFIWFMGIGSNPKDQAEQFEMTFYGSKEIATSQVNEEGSVILKICYYFVSSRCYQHPEIDGVFVSFHDKNGNLNMKLCLNPFSPRYRLFSDTDLFRKLSSVHCIDDPNQREALGKAFIADCDFKRDDNKKVLEFIRKKYNDEYLLDLEFTSSSALTFIPDD